METQKDLLFSFGILQDKRYKEKDKLRFLQMAAKQLRSCGYGVKMTRASISWLCARKNCYNLYTDNIAAADTVFVTHYDTPVKQWVNASYQAFHPHLNKKNARVQFLLSMIILFGSVLLLGWVWMPRYMQMRSPFLLLTGMALASVSFCGIRLVFQGISQQDNLVSNTSGIVALLESALNGSSKDRVAYAFIDEGMNTEYGLKMFKECVGKGSKQIIYVDSPGGQGSLHIFSKSKQKAGSWHSLSGEKRKYGDVLITSGHWTGSEVRIEETKINKENISRCVAFMRQLVQ